MNGAITLTTPADVGAAIHLHLCSALHGCATITYNDGHIAFTPRYPVSIWSSGESVLWAAMSTLASGAELTAYDLDQAASVLDEDSATALREAVELWVNIGSDAVA